MNYANTSTTRSMLSPDYHLYKSHVSAQGISHTQSNHRSSSAPRYHDVPSTKNHATTTAQSGHSSMRPDPGKEHSVERLKSCIQDLKKLATSKVKKSSSHVGTHSSNTMGTVPSTKGNDRQSIYDNRYRQENHNPNQ
jgi:hypothetical protein